MSNFILSPTEALMFACTCWSKSKYVLRRASTDSAGLSVLFDLMPMLIFTEPCVFSCTPPGPNTLSSGPNPNCISRKLNGSFLFSSADKLLRAL